MYSMNCIQGLDNLRIAGVNIEAMRGQGYDGAANMSGWHRGVQARIMQVVPTTVYTHWKAHSLNLVIIHASKQQHVRNRMSTVQEMAFAFNYSAKRLRTTISRDTCQPPNQQSRTRI